MALKLMEKLRGSTDTIAPLEGRRVELDREIQKYLAEGEREKAKQLRADTEAARLFDEGAEDALQDAAEDTAKHAGRAAKRAEGKCASLRLERDSIAQKIKFHRALRAGLDAGEIGAADAELHLKLVPVRAAYFESRAQYNALRQSLPAEMLRQLPELPLPMPLVLDASGNPTSPHARAAAINPVAERFAFEIGRITENLKGIAS